MRMRLTLLLVFAVACESTPTQSPETRGRDVASPDRESPDGDAGLSIDVGTFDAGLIAEVGIDADLGTPDSGPGEEHDIGPGEDAEPIGDIGGDEDAGQIADVAVEDVDQPTEDAAVDDAGEPNDDAGGLEDAEAPEVFDAELAEDAEIVDLSVDDAGEETDLGIQDDGGVEDDTGVPDDAGHIADAGHVADMGIIVDTGISTDSGAPDSGVVGPPIALVLNKTFVSGQITHTEPFRVRLAAAPSATIRIPIRPTDPSTVLVSPTEVEFTPANWFTEQEVTIDAIRDEDCYDDRSEVVLEAQGVLRASVHVNINDEVGHRPVRLVAGFVHGLEGDTVITHASPTCAPAWTDPISLNLSRIGSSTVTPMSLTVTSTNRRNARELSIESPVDTNSMIEDEWLELFSPTRPLFPTGMAVRVLDTQGPPEMFVDRASLVIDKNTTGIVRVRLSAPPTTTATVSVSSFRPGLAVQPRSLTFTPTNFAIPQAVSVGATDAGGTVRLQSASMRNLSVGVFVRDPAPHRLVVSTSRPTVMEGAQSTMTVHLSAPPVDPTDFFVVMDHRGFDPPLDIQPTTLTFDANNYDVPQTITLTGLQDLGDRDDVGEFKIDAYRSRIQGARVLVTIIDDD